MCNDFSVFSGFGLTVAWFGLVSGLVCYGLSCSEYLFVA